MRFRTLCFAVTALVIGGLFFEAHAQQPKIIGDWVVSADADRFSDTKTNVIAMTAGRHGGILALRCLAGELSLALGGQKFDTGDTFVIKFRADKRDVIDTTGAAISEALMQIETSKEMVREMLTAKEYALRVTGVASNDFIFRAGQGAAKALGEVTKACPLE